MIDWATSVNSTIWRPLGELNEWERDDHHFFLVLLPFETIHDSKRAHRRTWNHTIHEFYYILWFQKPKAKSNGSCAVLILLLHASAILLHAQSFTEQARTGMQGETAKARLRPRMRRPPSLTHAKPLLLDSASFGGEEAEEDRWAAAELSWPATMTDADSSAFKSTTHVCYCLWQSQRGMDWWVKRWARRWIKVDARGVK